MWDRRRRLDPHGKVIAMNIAEHIVGDATTFARTCLGLGYEKPRIEAALVAKFNVTSDQAAEILGGEFNQKEGSDGPTSS